MRAKLRVAVAVVHTGSRLVRLVCGTKIKVFALLPPLAAIAGRANAAAAPANKLRRFILVIPPLWQRPRHASVYVTLQILQPLSDESRSCGRNPALWHPLRRRWRCPG